MIENQEYCEIYVAMVTAAHIVIASHSHIGLID